MLVSWNGRQVIASSEWLAIVRRLIGNEVETDSKEDKGWVGPAERMSEL